MLFVPRTAKLETEVWQVCALDRMEVHIMEADARLKILSGPNVRRDGAMLLQVA
jgi:hypothetical protein